MNAVRKFFEDMQKLDMRDVGRWPLVFRALAIGIAFVAATGLLVWYFVFSEAQGNVPQLRKAEAEQQSLWQTFDDKQRRAANLEAYRLQLAEIERTFGAMLRQLPGRTEVPSLLVDISQGELKPAAPLGADRLLNGPVVNPSGRDDVMTSQDQVDELLESLGF